MLWSYNKTVGYLVGCGFNPQKTQRSVQIIIPRVVWEIQGLRPLMDMCIQCMCLHVYVDLVTSKQTWNQHISQYMFAKQTRSTPLFECTHHFLKSQTKHHRKFCKTILAPTDTTKKNNMTDVGVSEVMGDSQVATTPCGKSSSWVCSNMVCSAKRVSLGGQAQETRLERLGASELPV